MTERTDQRWIHDLKQEDEQAIIDLWQQLFVWAMTITQRKGQEEDAGRDGALAAYGRIMERGIYQYAFQGPFLGFCRRILVNEVYRRMKPIPALADIDDPTIPHPHSEDEAPLAEPGTIRARLEPCLGELKTRERAIVTLLYFEEQTPHDAAETLGLARGNVNVMAYRARNKLQDCLQGHGYMSSGDLLSL